MWILGKWLMKVFKLQLAAWQGKSDAWIKAVLNCLQKRNGEVLFVVPVRSNKCGEDLLGHLVCVAVSHPCTSFPCKLR